jgi:hypothetical protein
MEYLRTLAVLGAAALLIVALLQHFLTVRRDAREPPFVYPRIPVIGHLLGMMTQGSDYFHKLESRHHQALYTLPILNGRMYLATSPEWAQAIHKSHKSIQFNTLVAQAMKSLFLMDEDAMTVINQNLNNEDGTKEGVMVEVHDMVSNLECCPCFINDLGTFKSELTLLFRCSLLWLLGHISMT